jgi:hypothetical protein
MSKHDYHDPDHGLRETYHDLKVDWEAGRAIEHAINELVDLLAANPNATYDARRAWKQLLIYAPKNRSIPLYMLRGGPGWDYPCAIATMKECSLYECQALGYCKEADKRGDADGTP